VVAVIDSSRAFCLIRTYRMKALAALLLLLCPEIIEGATQSQKAAVVPKWTRFEQIFKSSVSYSNALQQASLRVTFTSPTGKSSQVDGFWDGGKTWKVRFAPQEVGRWSFQTSCSDAANRGLHSQKGSFICTALIAGTVFERHGPIRIARDHRRFEFADGTPFFWLADSCWNGLRVAKAKDFADYAAIRSSQKFSVVQWSLALRPDESGERPWTGTEQVSIRPEVFQRLDNRIEMLSRMGLESAIAPLDELNLQLNSDGTSPDLEKQLPDDQAALLIRYAVARWGAEPVAWLLMFEGDGKGRQANRWKKIGQAVFGSAPHAPVILYTGDTPWLLNEFRDQPWVDAFAYQTLTDSSDDAIKWLISGPLSTEWQNTPFRPVIAFTPAENAPSGTRNKRFSADDVRHAAWWSLLLSSPAGLSYSAHGVLNWDERLDSPGKASAGNFPLWHRALFMPAAKQMGHLSRFVSGTEFWKLEPRPEYLATQPGNVSPKDFVAAAGTPNKGCGRYRRKLSTSHTRSWRLAAHYESGTIGCAFFCER